MEVKGEEEREVGFPEFRLAGAISRRRWQQQSRSPLAAPSR